ncbi:unnamed protein product [Gordionus sp. m RMFG-2023]|uniref:RNA-binding protein NOB1-like n=1 Tax=Gordionus sp. m RMFG-2023 TaxID=3053472 RepID=UPI0030E2B0FD
MLFKKCQNLVVDSTAFLLNAPINVLGQNIYTIQEVVDEIKDENTRQRLSVLPYKLLIKEPQKEHFKAVVEAAKTTGDFSVLSLTDIKLIALAYEYYLEGIRDKANELLPPSSKEQILTTNHLNTTNNLSTTCATITNVWNTNKTIDKRKIIEADDKIFGFYSPAHSALNKKDDDVIRDLTLQMMEKIMIEQQCIDSPVENTSSKSDVIEMVDTDEMGDADDTYSINSETAQSRADENEEEGWITPGNLAVHIKNSGECDWTQLQEESDLNNGRSSDDDEEDGKDLEKKRVGDANNTSSDYVACLTDDFAMQNVLFKLKIPVRSSRNGGIIQAIKEYVLFCKACYKTTTDTHKKFCKHCGNKSLTRVAYSVDAEGNRALRINPQKMVGRRRTKFSLPAPAAGKHPKHSIVLKEGQKLAHNEAPRDRNRKRKYVESGTNFAGDSPFSKTDIESRAFLVSGLRSRR